MAAFHRHRTAIHVNTVENANSWSTGKADRLRDTVNKARTVLNVRM